MKKVSLILSVLFISLFSLLGLTGCSDNGNNKFDYIYVDASLPIMQGTSKSISSTFLLTNNENQIIWGQASNSDQFEEEDKEGIALFTLKIEAENPFTTKVQEAKFTLINDFTGDKIEIETLGTVYLENDSMNFLRPVVELKDSKLELKMYIGALTPNDNKIEYMHLNLDNAKFDLNTGLSGNTNIPNVQNTANK